MARDLYIFFNISLDDGAIGVVRLELLEGKDLKSVDSFLAGGNVSSLLNEIR
jgi:hypothetical protein